jgi:hypothetical protein
MPIVTTARLAESYPELPDVAGFPARYQRTFELEVLDHDPHAPEPAYGTYDRARDAVTVSLQAQGVWEAHETLAAVDILATQPGVFLDFGAHVGWYTVLAHLFGAHQVVAWENDPETLSVLIRNVSRVFPHRGMVGVPDVHLRGDVTATGRPVDVDGPVSLMKVDLEGADCWAVDTCAHLFEAGRVAAALVEVSPIFEHDGRGPCSYVSLVGRFMSWGYWPHQIPPKGWDRLDAYREDPVGTLRRHRALGDDWADVVAGCRQDNFLFLPA